jgi:hypothetical protein
VLSRLSRLASGQKQIPSFFPRPRRWSIETRRWARRRAARQTTVIAVANQCKWNLSFSIVLHFIYLYLPLLSLFTFSSLFTPSFYLFLFTLPACMPFFALFSFSCCTVDARRVHKRNILSEVSYTYTERQRKINEGWFHYRPHDLFIYLFCLWRPSNKLRASTHSEISKEKTKTIRRRNADILEHLGIVRQAATERKKERARWIERKILYTKCTTAHTQWRRGGVVLCSMSLGSSRYLATGYRVPVGLQAI